MRGRLEEIALDGPLSSRLNKRPEGGVHLYWLGQAGFVVDAGDCRLVIDPYLSDTLAGKYKGTARPHIRMMPPPVLPQDIHFVDLVLCTHAHTDHMDPGTLKPLLAHNPSALLIAPRATRQQALDRSGAGEERLILTNAGASLPPFRGLSIMPTAAAHEKLETDAEGNYSFLGYIIDAGAARLWHSGDCIPFPGLEREIAGHDPDIALLPVNGRRPELSENGVPGNFTVQEAIGIARRTGVAELVAHHYGLFDFNTETPENIDAAAASVVDLRIHRARTGVVFSWRQNKIAGLLS
jgi:L-ascorbate metabolism protein UlaG (beta-lactamase superfamily)